MRKILSAVLLISFSSVAFSQSEKVDAGMIDKIRNEGLKNSRVMDIAFHLTDGSGPRLTNSPGFYRAANWAVSEMKKWGLENPRLETWGNFGKGWELERSYLAMTAPYYKPIISFPKTWTSGTNGMKSADVIVVTAKDSISLDAYRGKLKNKIIIFSRTDTLRQSFKADANRFTDEQLTTMSNFKPVPRDSTRRNPQGNFNRGGPRPAATILKDIAKEENAIAILSAAPNGHDGTLFVQGGGSYAMDAPANFPDMVIAYEDFMMIQRLVNSGIPVKLEADVKTKFLDKDAKASNVFAEIKGTDPKLKDEIVMLGGHLDSWQGSTGATDNAAGCAVMMEAVRILKTLGVQPKRTIRIALWSGEEQGLLGSRNYVRNNLTDTATRTANAAGQKVSVYFNLDNGTGKIRGIYLQGNENAKPIFTEWMKSFNDIGANTITLQNTGGTDHLSFDAIGIPGFQFIQDQIEYNTRTHHTNMDSYDHLIAADLQQAATIVAAFVYNAAMRDEKIPRKN
ncbi:MAG TPA: M20/M25/M40 family metallo-hydrolase [Chitinophagaceae bacterium]|nr:M20/M25/M40 family metallo-hydrolase [Chitinophagaceae bacterium]